MVGHKSGPSEAVQGHLNAGKLTQQLSPPYDQSHSTKRYRQTGLRSSYAIAIAALVGSIYLFLMENGFTAYF